MVIHITALFPDETSRPLAGYRRRMPQSACSTSSKVSDIESTTSSLHDIPGGGAVDLDGIDRLPTESPQSDESLLSPQTCGRRIYLIKEIGAQFGHIPTISDKVNSLSSHRRRWSLPPNDATEIDRPIVTSSFHSRDTRNLPCPPALLAAATALQATIPVITLPLPTVLPEGARASLGRSATTPVTATALGTQPQSAVSPTQTGSTIATLPNSDRTTKHPHFLNPLVVLYPDEFVGQGEFSKYRTTCLGCYPKRPDEFFKKVLTQVQKHRDFLKLSDHDIKKAKQQSEQLKTGEERLRKIWTLLFTSTCPDIYPVAGKDHRHRPIHSRSKGKGRNVKVAHLTATSTADASPDATASSGFIDHGSTTSTVILPNLFEKPQLPDVRNSGTYHSSSSLDASLPHSSSTFLGGRMHPPSSQTVTISQRLSRLYSHSHNDPSDADSLWKIALLGNLLHSIDLLLHFAFELVCSQPLDSLQNQNSMEDYFNITVLTPFDLQLSDTVSSVHKEFIEYVNQRVELLHNTAYDDTIETPRGWRDFVWKFFIQKVDTLWTDAIRCQASPPNCEQSFTNINDQLSLLFWCRQTPWSGGTRVDISQSVTDLSSSSTAASRRPVSTAATSLDNYEQVTPAQRKPQ